jgi:Zn-dependent peptidase ImmA (M78 family)/DNA-binding XRE family transcriptional regulator
MELKYFPERLKSARKMRGLSLQDLADRLGNKISKQALAKYESGKSKPSMVLIPELSAVLSIPQDYFYRSHRVDLGKLSFRKLSHLSSRQQDLLICQTRDFLERYLELEDILGIDTHFVNPVANWVVNNMADIDELSAYFRRVLNLGDAPLFNVIELLEELKIKVCEISVDLSFSGMSTWVDRHFPVIVLNCHPDIPPDRKRFTALHELGHLILNLERFTEKEQEFFCNAFAAAMLFPKSRVMDEMGGFRHQILIEELGGIKRQYGISMQAIMYRMKSLQLVSESYYKGFAIQFNAKGYKKNEPFSYEGPEKSGRFRQLLLRAVAEECISISKGAALSNQKLSDFRKALI